MNSALVFLALVALRKVNRYLFSYKNFKTGVPLPRTFEGRIVNGEEVKLGEIPHQVTLQTQDNFHFCGGSILNKDHVITAAYCVEGKKATDIKVIAGSIDLTDPQAVHFVVKIVVHPEYNPNASWINDIAIFKVAEPFEFSETLSHVSLPEPYAKVPTNSIAIVSDWGRLWNEGDLPLKLQRTDILIADPAYCSKVYNELGSRFVIRHSQICASNPTVEAGSCQGDLGGPLTVDGTLVGLVSWSWTCSLTKYPTVYTRVSEFVEWINNNAF